MGLIEAIRSILGHGDLSATEKLVLVALWRHANDEGACWPSVTTIARETSLSERWVRRVLSSLSAKGWLQREGAPGRVTRYTVRTTPELGSPGNSVHPGTQFTPEASSGDPGTEFTPELSSPLNGVYPGTQFRGPRNSVPPKYPKKIPKKLPIYR